MGLFSNDFTLAKFIRAARKNGLPVGFLLQVSQSYSFGRLATDSSSDDYVSPWLDRLYLRSDTLESVEIMALDGDLSEVSGIGTIYHECTHAYLDLESDRSHVSDLLRRAARYYADARLADGSKVSDEDRVVQEACAEYVGTRAATYWRTAEMLAKAGMMLRAQDENEPKVARLLKRIPVLYEKYMAERKHGYQMTGPFWNRVQTPTTKPFFPALRTYCDEVILERAVPDHFAHATALVTTYRKLCQGSASMPCRY